MTMKLMSWNVGKPRKDTLLAYYPKIKDENVDIFALQEVVPDTIEHIKEGLSEIGLNYIETSCNLAVDLDMQTGPHKNGTVTDGVLIASRWPLKLIPEFFEKIPWQKSALSTIVTTPYGEIELHTVHIPNASSSGRWEEKPGGDWDYVSKAKETSKEISRKIKRRGRQVKVDAFKGVHAALSTPTVSNRHRILCGDFNSPKKESSEGNTYWGTKREHRSGEKQVIEGLKKEHDLEDTYRKLHPDYNDGAYSHVNPNAPNRRYDHIFSSKSLNPQKCDYLHSLRKGNNNKCLHHYEKGDLSDHSPIYATYEPEAS